MKIGPPRSFNVSQLKTFFRTKQTCHAHIFEIVNELRRLSLKINTQMTEVPDEEDSRSQSNLMNEAVEFEIKGLVKRKTFKIVKESRLPPWGKYSSMSIHQDHQF